MIVPCPGMMAVCHPISECYIPMLGFLRLRAVCHLCVLLRLGSAGDGIDGQLMMSANIQSDFLGDRSNANLPGNGSITLHKLCIPQLTHRQKPHGFLGTSYSFRSGLTCNYEVRRTIYIVSWKV